MPSNRTVPTPIVNKNGVSTTVYKRVDNVSAAKRVSIPAPSRSAAKQLLAERAEAAMEQIRKDPGGLGSCLLNELSRESYKLSENLRNKTLATLHPETLNRLSRTKYVVLNPITRAMGSSLMQRNFALLNNMAALSSLCDEQNYAAFSYYVAGLNLNRPVSEYRDFGDASESELDVPKALIVAAMKMNKPYVDSTTNGASPAYYLRSEKLIDLIERRHGDVRDIVNLLMERKLPVATDADIEVIENMLDEGSQALREGAL